MSPLTDEIGRIVGGRYRIVAAVGSGPSARVYLADDVRLRRRVAIKLLPEALAEEVAFLERFRSEMQSAAGLRHPHILVVHDWGTEGGLHLVTEYVDGGSLRAMLDRGVRLSPSQALQVGLAASRALDFAHSRGVVHRDVKPANLLFTDDGRLRIGDFGLARAFADAAWTEPLGSAGTAARYASPEQAQGRSVDGRADVYSLALVLVEAVTGALPFQADTALGTLMARVGTTLPVPDELGPLAEPLSRAGADEPEARLDAAEFGVALMAVASQLPPPAPLTLTPSTIEVVDDVPHEDDTIVVSGDELGRLRAAAASTTILGDGPAAASERQDGAGPTVAVPTPMPPDDAAASGVRSAPAPLPTAEPRSAPSPGVAPRPIEAVGPSSLPDAAARSVEPSIVDARDIDPSDVDPVDEARRRRNRRRWSIAWISLLVVALVGGGVVGTLIWRANQTPTHLIPKVTGQNEPAAVASLKRLGFEPIVLRERRDGTKRGDLLGTRPPAGSRLAEGRKVTVLVSAGQTLVTVPGDLVGKAEPVATAAITKVGLVPGAAQQDWSETVPSGVVTGLASGTPKRLEKGSSVTLIVSKGPQPRVIPDVSGMTPDQAGAALTQIGLVPHTVERFDTKVDKGGLIGLEPGTGTSVARGSDVNVVVSKGLLVAVPSLDGVNTVPGAILKLTQAGLVPDELLGTGRLWGRPVAFDPPEGQLVAKGSSINIVVR